MSLGERGRTVIVYNDEDSRINWWKICFVRSRGSISFFFVLPVDKFSRNSFFFSFIYFAPFVPLSLVPSSRYPCTSLRSRLGVYLIVPKPSVILAGASPLVWELGDALGRPHAGMRDNCPHVNWIGTKYTICKKVLPRYKSHSYCLCSSQRWPKKAQWRRRVLACSSHFRRELPCSTSVLPLHIMYSSGGAVLSPKKDTSATSFYSFI